MLKVKKIMLIVMTAIAMMILVKVDTIYASTIKDTEPNNSYHEAQNLSINRMTYSHRVSGNYDSYNCAEGTLSGNDEDWYYIYHFLIDEVYLTISGGTGTMYFDIIDDSTKEVIQTITYMNTSEHVFEVNLEKGKYYYIRVYHKLTDINSNYKFSIGNPEYLLGSYTYEFKKITLPANGEWEGGVNLVEIGAVPKQAIGYKITILGCTSSVSSSRYYTNDLSSGWTATKIGFYYNIPVIKKSTLDQEWRIKYESSSKKDVSFYPQFTMLYVYPRLPLIK